jgi:type I restriction enzyme R subunit
LDVLLARFIELMTGQARPYLDLTHGKVDDKMVERAIDAFVDQGKREEFYKFIKELETLYEILSPSPGLRDYVEDFGLLSILYQIVRNAFRKKTGLYGDIAKKTEQLVREKVTTYGLETTTPTVKIDETTLKALKDSKATTNIKVINLINSIIKTATYEGDESPYLKPIGERAEAIQEAFDNRQVTALDALRKVEALIKEVLEARRQQEETGFDINTFTIYWLLKQENVKWFEKLAPIVNNAFLRFPNFKDNIAELRQLKAELYKLLLPAVGKDIMLGIVEKLLRLDRK